MLIGEMRDLETIEAALTIAETGHLTFATLHTNSAAQTINRIIDVFPAHQQRRSARSSRWCSRASSARRCCPRRRSRAACSRSRSWCRHRRSEPDPRGQGPPDLLGDADRARRSSACRR